MLTDQAKGGLRGLAVAVGQNETYQLTYRYMVGQVMRYMVDQGLVPVPWIVSQVWL